MDLARSQRLIETLEADPAKVPAYYLHLENVIAWCMDEIFRLAKSGEDGEHKIKLVALEYRARLVLERFWKSTPINKKRECHGYRTRTGRTACSSDVRHVDLRTL